MTQTSAFHFDSLGWDWPIAIYLFLIGISAGLVTLAVLLRRFDPQAVGAESTLLRTTLIVGPGAVILGLLILVFHLFCRSGDAGRAVTSLLPAGGRCRQYVAAHHADCRAGRGDPRSVDPRLPPDKTVDLLEADVPLQFYLGDVDGGDAVSALHGGAGAVAGENL